MRTLTSLALMAGLVFAVAVRDAGAVTVDLIWVASSGAGTACAGGTYGTGCALAPSPNGVGEADIFADAGDTLTLDMQLVIDPGQSIKAYGASIRFDTDLVNELNLLNFKERKINDNGGLPYGGSLAPVSGGTLFSTQESTTGGVEGHAFQCEAVGGASFLGTSVRSPGTYRACTFTFLVTGNVVTDGKDVFSGTFSPVDGFVDSLGLSFIPSGFNDASVNLVPEPGTATLLGLGLLGLTLAGSRKLRKS